MPSRYGLTRALALEVAEPDPSAVVAVTRTRNRQSLPKIELVQLEMPLTPLYEGESSFSELYDVMRHEGYSLVGLESGCNDPRTGRVLQVDGTFHRG